MKITTGSVNKLGSKNIVTFCLPNKAIEIRVNGTFKELERKLWVYLIHRAYEKNELLSGDIHIISFDEIASVFVEFNATKDYSRIWEYIKRLSEIKVSFKCGSDIEGFSSLLSCSLIDYSKKIVKYQIPALLEEFYSNQDLPYSRIRTHFLLGLKGKYSISLYMLMERYVNRRNPQFEISLEDLRHELKVEDGKLTSWPDFKKRVLDPASKEISSKADSCDNTNHGSGMYFDFSVSKKKGKKVTHLLFIVEKSAKRTQWDASLKSSKRRDNEEETIQQESITINLDWEKVEALLRKRSISCDKYSYFDDWKQWIIHTKKASSLQMPEFSYVGFLAKKLSSA